MTEYTLTLNEAQCHEVHKAVELLMRLKLGQYQELIYALCDIMNPNFAEQLSQADTLFKVAFETMNKGKKSNEYKDEEWWRLYNIYQVLRKAIHDAEHPESTGIDSTTPLQFTDEKLPEISWIKKGSDQ